MNIEKNSINNNISFGKRIFQILIVFSFIYEVQPIGIPDLFTSRKIVFYILAVIYFMENNFRFSFYCKDDKFGRTNKTIFLLSVVMLFHVIIVSKIDSINGSPTGESIFSRTLLFILFVPIICLFTYNVFHSIEEFMFALMWATLLQCVIVIPDYFFQSVKIFLNNHFVLDTNYGYLSPYRAAGLGAGESLLSINLFLGTIGCAYFMFHKKNILPYTFSFLIISFAAFLSGSTGFLFCLLLLTACILYLLIESKNFKAIKIILFIVLGLFLLMYFLPNFFSQINDFQIFKKIKVIFLEGASESHTVQSLRKQEIAPITFDTIIGTGLYRGYSGSGLFNRSDTGYLQAYFGYGLIMAIIYYGILYKNMLKEAFHINDKKTKFLIICLFVVIALGEAKEPYLQHYGEPFVFFLSCYLCHKDVKE